MAAAKLALGMRGFKMGLAGDLTITHTYTARYQYANGLLVASVALLVLWSIAIIAFALHFHYLPSPSLRLCVYLCACVSVSVFLSAKEKHKSKHA